MNPGDSLSLLACQIEVPVTRSAAARDAHLAAMRAKVETALSRATADLVVLPELSSIEYSRLAFEALDALAEPAEGPSLATWSAVAQRFGCHVAFSFPRREGGAVFITLAVVGPDGRLAGSYDKIYLAQFGASMEKEFFTQGDGLSVFDIKGFRVGLSICADIRIPELSRALTLDGRADLILHSGAYYRDSTFHSWHSFVVARALENQVFFLSLNRAGTDYGASMLCPPWVDEIRKPYLFADTGEELVRLVADRAEITLARENYAFLKDRKAQHALRDAPASNPEPIPHE